MSVFGSSALNTITETNDPHSQDVQEVEEIKFFPNRVFINKVDCFVGRQIAKILTQKLFRDQQKAEFPGEGGEGPEEEEPVLESPYHNIKQSYQVVGTLKNKFYKVPMEVVTESLNDEDESFTKEVFKCGFVIYDITMDPEDIQKARNTLIAIERELEEIKEQTPKKFRNMDMRIFLLISPIMTWAKTRPIDPEEPDVPFVETDFRKRRPHPNYKQHIDFEKEVMQKGKRFKDKLLTIVIASGIIYGEEEEDLHFLFKLAWQFGSNLPVMLPGNNTVPLINIKDIASIIFALFENPPKKPKYILAVEQTLCTQKQIVKSISKNLGNDRIRFTSKEESFLYPDLTQNTHERLCVNLKMEPSSIVTELDIQWQTDLNFCENITKIVKEYKESRKLEPINILLHGPPAVGKTTIAKQLAEYYNIPYISVATLIQDTLSELKKNIEYGREMLRIKREKMEKAEREDEEVEEEEEEDDEDWDAKLEEWQDKLIEIEKGLDENDERLPDHQVIQLLRDKLSSNFCQNHGYILDGYPKTSEQTREVFEFEEGDEGGEEEEEEEEEGDEPKKFILPHFVISLEASDDFLCNRIMKLPENMIQGTHYAEEPMIQRLTEFRRNNTEDNTLLNIFDEREIHPYIINAETDDVETVLSLIKQKIGDPKGYPLSEYELEELRKKEEEERRIQSEEEAKERAEMDRKAEEERMENMEKWVELLQTMQQEEQQLLAAQCKPLREYLVKFVFPTLTKGLLETAKIKPDDPVDFLAEFLFKENPEGRMFDPSYIATADEMYRIIEEYKEKFNRNETN